MRRANEGERQLAEAHAHGQDLSDDVTMLCLTTRAQLGPASKPDAMTGQRPAAVGRPDAVQRLDLAPDASSATLARRFIRRFAGANSLQGEVVDQLGLVGTELVTNAVLHARTALTLTLELFADRVRISVTDRSPAPALVRRSRPESPSGRGLALVGAVSRRWGVDRVGVGKRVWAEIDRPPTPDR